MSRYKNYLSQSTAYKNKSIFVQLVARHLSKGHFKLLSNCFVFLLFGNKFVLESVNLLLELLDRFVSKFSSSLSLLQLGGQGLDLLLVGLLSLVGLLLGDLQRLEVVGHNSQLLLELKDLGLAVVGSPLSLLQVRLTGSELLGNLLIRSISSLGLVSGILEFFLQLSDSLVIISGFVLKDLLGSFGVVSSSSSLVKLGVGLLEFLLGLLEVLLKARYSSVQGVHLSLGGHQSLLLLLELEGDNSKPLGAEVKLSLQLSGLGSKLGDFIFSLGCSELGSLACLLTLVGSVAGIVLLDLHGLHLLLDCVHRCNLIVDAQELKRSR